MIFVIIVALMKTERVNQIFTIEFSFIVITSINKKLNIKKETNESAKYLHTYFKIWPSSEVLIH